MSVYTNDVLHEQKNGVGFITLNRQSFERFVARNGARTHIRVADVARRPAGESGGDPWQ